MTFESMYLGPGLYLEGAYLGPGLYLEGAYLGPGLYLEGVSLSRLQVCDGALTLAGIEMSGLLWYEGFPILWLRAPLDREPGNNPVSLKKGRQNNNSKL